MEVNIDAIYSKIREIEETFYDNNRGERRQFMNENENYKEILLQNLHGQVDFLRKEVEEKNLLLRALVLRESNSIYPETRCMTPLLSPNQMIEEISQTHKKVKVKPISKENIYEETPNDVKIKPLIRQKERKNSLLIAGDCNIDQKRLPKGYDVKVRIYPGRSIADMFGHLEPLMDKKPKRIYLKVEGRDSRSKSSNQIYSELTTLKEMIEDRLPNTRVILSYPGDKPTKQKSLQ